MVYLVAIIDVAFVVCGRRGLADIVYLVAVMDMFCGSCLWPSGKPGNVGGFDTVREMTKGQGIVRGKPTLE